VSPRTSDRLDPVSRLGPPRPGTLLRALLVTALLGLAAAALYTEADSGCTLSSGSSPTPRASDGPLPLPSGLVGVPVRLADAAPLAVLRRGDRVDLVALPAPPDDVPSPAGRSDGPAAAGGEDPSVLAAGALMLDAVADAHNPVIYLALTRAQAHAVLSAARGVQFAVVVRSG
jgi:hypothetical protein